MSNRNDIRLDIGFLNHPKTVKLKRRLGADAVLGLEQLWTFAAQYRPSGDLSGMDVEDIEIAAGWDGPSSPQGGVKPPSSPPSRGVEAPAQAPHAGSNGGPSSGSIFVDTLVQIGFLDENANGYEIHDWAEHNPYYHEHADASDRGRLNRMKSTHPEIWRKLKDLGHTGVSRSEYERLTAKENQAPESPPQAPLKGDSPNYLSPSRAVPCRAVPYKDNAAARAGARDTPPESQKSTNRSFLPYAELPDDWRAYATEHRPDIDADALWERFVAQTAGQTSPDWKHRWRTWVDQEVRLTTDQQSGKPKDTKNNTYEWAKKRGITS